MISLKNLEPFACGGKRACYQHPEQPQRCLKVYLPGRSPEDQKQADPWWKQLRPSSAYDENIRDSKNVAQIYAQAGKIAGKHFPEIEGTIDTDLGSALCLELICDHNGDISQSAKEYIINHGITPELEAAIEALGAFLLEHKILFRDPFPHNISIRIQSDGSMDAVIIDGLGDSSFLPYHRFIPGLTAKKIKKKHARLKKGVIKTQAVDQHSPKGIRTTSS